MEAALVRQKVGFCVLLLLCFFTLINHDHETSSNGKWRKGTSSGSSSKAYSQSQKESACGGRRAEGGGRVR